jgi:hypothetical protein
MFCQFLLPFSLTKRGEKKRDLSKITYQTKTIQEQYNNTHTPYVRQLYGQKTAKLAVKHEVRNELYNNLWPSNFGYYTIHMNIAEQLWHPNPGCHCRQGQ